MSARIGFTVSALFVITEALAWFYAMFVFSSVYERGVLRDLASRLDASTVAVRPRDAREGTGDPADAGARPRATSTPAATVAGLDAIAGGRAAEVARTAAETATAGPQWYVVLAAALGAFALTRFIRTAHLGVLGTALGIIVSIAALSLVWRVVLVGDIRFWDYAAVARFFEDPNSANFAPIDVVAFTLNPDPAVADARSQGLSLIGVGALWIRFLLAGRSPLQFETVLRSFSATFPVVLVTTLAGSAWRIPGGGVAVAYFASAVLLLALSNAQRATDRGAAAHLAAADGLLGRARALLGNPWVFAGAATLALMASTALALVFLGSLGAGSAVLILGGYVGRVVEFVLLILVTPIYWLMTLVSGWLGLGVVDLSFLSRALDNARPEIPPDQLARRGSLPWVRDAFRLASFALLAYIVYRAGRWMFTRLESRRADNAEGDRSAISSPGGFGRLFRAAFSGPGRNPNDDGRWLRRQPAYWLYGRMVQGAVDRRFAPRKGETPLEFASASMAALAAPVFAPIAAQFDRARYGEHFATEEELRPLAVALREWEEANPITEEIRLRPGRDEEAPTIELEPSTEVPQAPADIVGPI